MGREAQAQVTWQGQTGTSKVLLEAQALILRGQVRARIARNAILEWRVVGPDLVLSTPDGPLNLTLGAGPANAWAIALSKSVPSLRDKLGLSATKQAFALTEVDDPALAQALDGYQATTIAGAACLIAVLRDTQTLDQVVQVVVAHVVPLWAVHEKGRGTSLPESLIRSSLRDAGCIDTKACAVSDRYSATRYDWRKLPLAER